ncbi:putative membrane protein [Staphylococcus aureus]|nr:putative membrane protein [Staphylococcus aureus]
MFRKVGKLNLFFSKYLYTNIESALVFFGYGQIFIIKIA